MPSFHSNHIDASRRQSVNARRLNGAMLFAARFSCRMGAIGELASMTGEEMQQIMNLILERHAQLTINLQRLTEYQAQMTQAPAQLTKVTAHLDKVRRRLAKAQTHTDAKMAELAKVQARTDERFADLAKFMAHTDQKLAALIRLVREQHNGKA